MESSKAHQLAKKVICETQNTPAYFTLPLAAPYSFFSANSKWNISEIEKERTSMQERRNPTPFFRGHIYMQLYTQCSDVTAHMRRLKSIGKLPHRSSHKSE